MTATEIRQQAQETLKIVYDIAGRKNADPAKINTGVSVHLAVAAYEIAAQLAELRETLRLLPTRFDAKSEHP